MRAGRSKRFELRRDRSFTGDDRAQLEDVPAGVTAEIAPERDRRARRQLLRRPHAARVRGPAGLPRGAALTVRARSAGFPDKTMAVPLETRGADGDRQPGPGARTARLRLPGTTVRLDGNGFCPGSAGQHGQHPRRSPTRRWPTTARACTFATPRSGDERAGGRHARRTASYPTDNDVLTVRSFRGETASRSRTTLRRPLADRADRRVRGRRPVPAGQPVLAVGLVHVVTGILDPIAAIEWPIFRRASCAAATATATA